MERKLQLPDFENSTIPDSLVEAQALVKQFSVISGQSRPSQLSAMIAESARMLSLDWVQERLSSRWERLSKSAGEPFSV